MVHWRSHVISCVQPKPSAEIKLIRSDGHVMNFDRPISVSDLMTEHPKHQICRTDSLCIGQKIPSLSGKDKLRPGNSYFLLPNHYFQSAVSFVSIASFASSYCNSQLRPGNTNSNVILRKAEICQPFDIQRTPDGCVRVRITDEFLSRLVEARQSKLVEGRMCTTPQLEKEYKQLMRQTWKPKLDTIRESKENRKKNFAKNLSFKKLRKCRSMGSDL